MVGINPNVISHALNIDKRFPSKQQKRRLLNDNRQKALKKEVDGSKANRFIRDAFYPDWIANPVLVLKPNGTWQTCINYSDLNTAGPKDCFPLPRINIRFFTGRN